jgi:hypothetical protein
MNEPDPTRADLLDAGRDLFRLAEPPAKVLIIVDGPEGLKASCTERDHAEIRGLMYRAGSALPEPEAP